VSELSSAFALAAALCVLSAGCGGSSGSGSPTGPGPVTPGPVPSSPDAWTIEGTVVATISRAPVVAAAVKATFAEAVQTDAQGQFRLSGTSVPSPSTFKLTLSAPGHVTREVWVRWQRGTRQLALDMVAETAPFSLSFYRQIARDDYEEEDGLEDLLVWRSAPSFYVRTTDEDGKALASGIVRTLTNTIRTAVRDFTGGRFSAAAVETGTATRRERPGWVNVHVVRDLDDACGTAFVGSSPGEIKLLLRGCGCDDREISSEVVAHEVGHALGFFHVSDRRSIMYPFVGGNCPNGTLTEADQHHVTVAYSRPRGNSDPDTDPQTVSLVDRRIRIVN
jgi:hypothetical protein